jgi:hypothetical protein
MIAFETGVGIERGIEDVFDYVADPRNFPDWNSAVEVVRPTSPNGAGATYAMQRRLPDGRATNLLEVVTSERPREFAIRTTSGPTTFLYRYRFIAGEGGTAVRLDAKVELPAVARLVPTLARRAVKHGVDENLATLKLILERRGG